MATDLARSASLSSLVSASRARSRPPEEMKATIWRISSRSSQMPWFRQTLMTTPEWPA